MKALEMTSLYHKKTSHQRKKTSFYRKETSFQDLTPIAERPFTLCFCVLHPYPPRFSPIAYGANPVLPNHSPSITKWLRRYRQTNAFCCFRCCETWSFGDFEKLLPNSQSPHLQESKAILLHSHAHSTNATPPQRSLQTVEFRSRPKFHCFIFIRKKKLVGRRCIIIGGITIF